MGMATVRVKLFTSVSVTARPGHPPYVDPARLPERIEAKRWYSDEGGHRQSVTAETPSTRPAIGFESASERDDALEDLRGWRPERETDWWPAKRWTGRVQP